MRRLLCKRRGIALDARVEVVDDELDETPLPRRGGVDPLAGHGQPARTARRDQTWGTLGTAAPRQEAEVDLREAELRVDVRDAEVTGERDLQAATEAVAVDRRDDGDGRALDQVGGRLDAGGTAAVVALPDEATDVGACRERAVALATQHHHADVVVERLELRPERLDDSGVDRVDGRVVEPD